MSGPDRSVKMNRPFRLLALALGVLVGIAGLCWAETPAPSTSRTVSCTSVYKKKGVPTKTLSSDRAVSRSMARRSIQPKLSPGRSVHGGSSRATLNGADLERANLEGANLQHANLYQSSLAHAHLSGADLTSAGLEDSNLSGADMRQTRLSRANLFRVIGDEAALFNSVLVGAQLHESSFERTHFEGADLTSTDFTNASVVDSYFYGANLIKRRSLKRTLREPTSARHTSSRRT